MSLTFLGISGILVAFILNHLISKINPFLIQFINLYSIPIIYIATKKLKPSSILVTATAGMLEDIVSFFPIGVNALKKLILLFFINKVSSYISISSFFGCFILLIFSIVFELGILILITGFFGLKNPMGAFKEVLVFQPLITSIIGAPFFIFFNSISNKE